LVCSFFGHSNCPDSIRQNLKEEIVKIIGGPETVYFYVGHQGHFDGMVRSIMKELIKEGYDINYSVVLAYMPGKKYEFDASNEYADTMYPEGLESVHPKFAITWRNNWMTTQTLVLSHRYMNLQQIFRDRYKNRKNRDNCEAKINLIK